jgi:protease-4
MHPEEVMAAGLQLQELFDISQSRSNSSFTEIGPLPKMVISANDSNEEVPSYDEVQSDAIALFSVSGTMLKYGTMCSYGTAEIAEDILLAAENKNIKAAVFEIDSGGGAVNSVPPVADAVRKFKSSGKSIIALIDSAYSAAYWLASECDHIMAGNSVSAGAGSIGVMMSFADAKGYYEQRGYKVHTIYAPESSEKNKPFELALEGKYEMIQTEQLSPLAVKFQNTVKANRQGKLKMDEGDKVLKGKTYMAEAALDIGLIDSIGNRDRAISWARDRVTAYNFMQEFNQQ